MVLMVPNTQVAANHNNAGALARWDAITDSNSVAFLMPQQLPFRTRGERRYRLDGSVARVGQNATALLFSIMTLAQYALLLSTYEGLVTVKIALTSTTYANYNATLIVPDENELTFRRALSGVGKAANFSGPGYQDVQIELRDLEAL